jgi:hypothetical protein
VIAISNDLQCDVLEVGGLDQHCHWALADGNTCATWRLQMPMRSLDPIASGGASSAVACSSTPVPQLWTETHSHSHSLSLVCVYRCLLTHVWLSLFAVMACDGWGQQREARQRTKELSRRIHAANQQRLATAPVARPRPKEASTRQKAAEYAKSSVPRPELLKQRSTKDERAAAASLVPVEVRDIGS